jgi:hypothetical protein
VLHLYSSPQPSPPLCSHLSSHFSSTRQQPIWCWPDVFAYTRGSSFNRRRQVSFYFSVAGCVLPRLHRPSYNRHMAFSSIWVYASPTPLRPLPTSSSSPMPLVY